MSRMTTTMTSGVIVALLATFSMAAPSFAAGKKTHHRKAAMHRGPMAPAPAPAASLHNGKGSPFADGDIFGGTGPSRPAQTAGYSSGGLFGGGGVLGTGALNGQGAFGIGVFGL